MYDLMKSIFLLLFVVSSSLSANSKPLNEAWLKKDKSNFINLMEVIQSKSSDLEFYKKSIHYFDIRKEENIGFGLKRIHGYQSGGYISNSISILVYQSKVFYIKVEIEGKAIEKIKILKARDTQIQKLLDENWREDAYTLLDSFVVKQLKYETLDEKVYFSFKNQVIKRLGSPLALSVNISLNNEYETLMFPFEQYEFGTACGYAGTRPKGRKAIEIIKTQAPVLLKNIIRGYSLEGRVYGVEALLELSNKGMVKLTKNDIDVIKKVLSLDIPLATCGGCMSYSTNAKQIFQSELYQTLFSKNKLLIKFNN
ncbi:MAG: Unknown protein [uncultured Sulfurovum sp.]|uniref:Uncharacterized protein n=1 Tax=uncultured Sulfurovum sp. TaxID=269237 RepID=A0A6S6T1L9_9BACT|nr:MAG: Unknown protein [uncultured Sulfurovum sp.]